MDKVFNVIKIIIALLIVAAVLYVISDSINHESGEKEEYLDYVYAEGANDYYNKVFEDSTATFYIDYEAVYSYIEDRFGSDEAERMLEEVPTQENPIIEKLTPEEVTEDRDYDHYE